MPEFGITKLPNPILRTVTKRVTKFDEDLLQLIELMHKTMYSARGVGLAAPQIDRSIKLAVLEYDPKRFDEETGSNEPVIPFITIINPKITYFSKEKEMVDEGCLSIPNMAMPVSRSKEIHVLAQDARGDRIRIRAKGLLARILQHEIDHLNGILIIDRTPDNKYKRFSETAHE